MSASTDRIEQQIHLDAPRDRVWRAIADAREFGSWFGLALDGPFVAGRPISGPVVPTTVDAEIAAMQAPYAGNLVEFTVERIEPPRLFALRWHPGPLDPKADYSAEPTTQVEFTLQDAPNGTLLTVVESGYDRIPPGRRTEAFARNKKGWEMQVRLIAKYLSLGAATAATAPDTGIAGFHGVRYLVTDVQRAIAFYTTHLGFTVERQQLPAFATVALGPLKLYLSGPGASGSRPLPQGAPQHPGGSNRVALRVRDLPAIISKLRLARVSFRNEMEVGPGGRQIQVLDPDGNPIELFEPAP